MAMRVFGEEDKRVRNSACLYPLMLEDEALIKDDPGHLIERHFAAVA